ncbi:MAG: hypothetical protein HWD58_07875 [Bacteroidota bacterium]|nr:MAG: hypothetical protein HWD58_07875 [Bacteroidota bacterium]
MAENWYLPWPTVSLKKRPMTDVQHIQNDQHWHTSFSSNAPNHSVHAEPSVYSAVQTLGTNMIPNAGKRKFRFTPIWHLTTPHLTSS